MEVRNPDLCLDHQLEILSFLPAKSVVRFRSVCKLWNSETLREQFMYKHLEHRKTLEANTIAFQSSGIYCGFKGETTFHVCKLKSSSMGIIPQAVIPTDPFPLDYFRVLFSCDGLLCLLGDGWEKCHRICLTNPLNRDYLLLPPILGTVVCGFGYDSTAREYKVVVKSCYPKTLTLSVCDIGLNDDPKEWRGVGDFPYVIDSPMGIVVEGRLHWIYYEKLDTSDDKEFDWSIISFDLHDEKLRKVPMDNIEIDCRKMVVAGHSNFMMTEVNCCLAIFFDSRKYSKFCLWVMEEYGKVESWTKMISFSYPLPRGLQWILTYVSYLKVDEKLLVFYQDRILSYDSNNSNCIILPEQPGNEVFPFHGYSRKLPFVTSLVTFANASKDWEKIWSVL